MEKVDHEASKKRNKKKKKKKTQINPKPPTEGIEDMIEANKPDQNLEFILQNLQQQKKQTEEERKEIMRKKLRAKIRSLRSNREPENDDNVKYDTNGKKIGRLQKQYINIPPGEIKTPDEINRFKHIMKGVANNPVVVDSFISKLGIDEKLCNTLLESATESKDGKELYERVEEII